MLSRARSTRVSGTGRGFALIVMTSSCGGSRLGIGGELDALTTPSMIDTALASPGSGELTLDLSRVVFIDAAGLGGLITVQREMSSLGRCLRIVGASPRIARTFALGGVAALLTPSPEQALLDQRTAALAHAAAAVRGLPGHRPAELRP